MKNPASLQPGSVSYWQVFSAAALAIAIAAFTVPAQAQFLMGDNPDWTETEAPPPPAFDMAKLLTVDVSPNSAMVFGVDPATVSVSSVDGIVRYVIVAVSSTGVKNAMYEAIRCSTGEVKTYARQSNEGKWNAIAQPEWRSMYGNIGSKHALRFAKAGACDNAASVASVKALEARLKSGQ